MADRPYSRIYHELADEYTDIYDSPDLAPYVRLLVAADQAWPSSARWTGYASKSEVARLQEVGLISCDGHRFRIKGMDKERNARSDAASIAARTRWGNATRNATRNAEVMPSQAKQSKDETRRAEPSPEHDALSAYYDLKGGQVSEGAVSFVNELVESHGDDRVISAMGVEAKETKVDQKFLSRVKGRLLVDGSRQAKAEEGDRVAAEIEERRRFKEEMESMPKERREANMTRLRESLKGTGLLS